MSEKLIEKNLCIGVRAHGGVALKLISPSMAGVPDRLVLMPGARVCFVELKAPGKIPTPKQLKVHEMLRKLGFEVRVIDSIEGVNEFVKEVFGK